MASQTSGLQPPTPRPYLSRSLHAWPGLSSWAPRRVDASALGLVSLPRSCFLPDPHRRSLSNSVHGVLALVATAKKRKKRTETPPAHEKKLALEENATLPRIPCAALARLLAEWGILCWNTIKSKKRAKPQKKRQNINAAKMHGTGGPQNPEYPNSSMAASSSLQGPPMSTPVDEFHAPLAIHRSCLVDRAGRKWQNET